MFADSRPVSPKGVAKIGKIRVQKTADHKKIKHI